MNNNFSLSLIFISIILIITSIFLDYSLSLLIFRSDNFFASLISFASGFIIYLLISFCFIIFAINNVKKKKYILVVLSLTISFFVVLFSFLYAQNFQLTNVEYFMLFSLVFNVLMFQTLSKINNKKFVLLEKFCKFLILYLITIFILNNTIKLIWGRVRFINVVKFNEKFYPFWHINFLSGATSFYSGHITSGCALIPIIDKFVNNVKKSLNKMLIVSVYLIFLLLIAYSRITLGMHYLSDIAFAILFCAISYSILQKVSKKFNL